MRLVGADLTNVDLDTQNRTPLVVEAFYLLDVPWEFAFVFLGIIIALVVVLLRQLL